MRTTLHLDDDIYEAAQSLAKAEGKRVGAVISRLARQGLAPRARTAKKGGFPVFVVEKEVPPITPEMVNRALED
jgi:hypothetical protein